MRFGLRVLNRRNWSSSSNLTSTKASHLISRPPEKRKVGGSIPPLATSSELNGHCESTLWTVWCVRFLSSRRVFGESVQPVEVRGYLVEFIGVEVAIDVGGDGGRGVPHGFLDVAKVGAQLGFLKRPRPVGVAAPVVRSEEAAVR